MQKALAFQVEVSKNQVDQGPTGENGKMLIFKDPPSYVYHVLSYVNTTHPKATGAVKSIGLFKGLPTHLT